MTGQSLGQYRIEEQLGAGGMGVVYRAYDTRLQRTVALKLLAETLPDEPQARSRLLREARAASALNHPSICTIYEVGEAGGRAFIAMEYVEGRTLRALAASGGLPMDLAARYGIQIADAVAHAHARGVIHRDLKSANVIITPEGRPKILDFGLATRLPQPDLDARTRSQSSLSGEPEGLRGTLQYMAPELLSGRPGDARSDVWALGVMLYEMATGELPFQGQTAYEWSAAVLREPPKPLAPCVHAAYRAAFQRCLAKDPAERFADAGQVRAALEAAAQPAAEPAQPAEQQSAIRRRAAAAAVVLVLALAVTAYLLVFHRPPAAVEPPRAGPVSLAILPFHVLTEPEEIGYLAIGIPDAIITRLANASQVRVRPTASIARYQNQRVDVQQAGRALEAENVLNGTVQKSGQRFRVSVQLVRVKDGATLWGEHYEVTAQDLLGLQDSIAQKVGSALQIRMTEAERARFYRRYTDNVAAYEWYLRGRAHLADASRRGRLAAIEAFESALRLDSGYALARAGLAMASAEMYLDFASGPELKKWRERAEREARQALAMDSSVAETHQALAGLYSRTESDWEGTIAESGRALELNPSLDWPHLYRAAAFYHLGLLDLAERDVEQSLANNPGNRVVPMRIRGVIALLAGRFTEAVRLLEEINRMSEIPRNEWYLAQAYYYAGRGAEAEALLERLSRSPAASGALRSQASLASFLAARGQRVRAEKLLRAVTRGGYTDHHVAFSAGAAYAQLGRRQEALRWLKRAIDTGFACAPWYDRDPLLESLRADIGFQRLASEVRKASEAARARYGGSGAGQAAAR